MEFYILDNANEPSITGNVYPQVANYRNWCYDNYEYIVSQLTPDQLPEKDFSLDYLELDTKAVLTDFISVYNPIWGFIISDKAKEVFDGCNLPIHKYFKTILKGQELIYTNYNWLYLVSEVGHKVDFKMSSFKLMKGFLSKQIDERGFSSVNEIAEFQKLNSRMRILPNKVYIQSSDVSTDIFKIGMFNFDWIVTKKLVDNLKSKGVTGYIAKKVDWLYTI
ncbi:hypothetical protein [Flavisolibacter tropicus]|uniref:Uncharacterized protein n=1 Tax=Flavisolibacter tropicus TaxID=1492898 RepID=A0A172U0I5_9BACT|nr:hypothetical protein [Flavisolibacter tropicus]ANE52830.1 hypothetical protein SY85_22485 [Flavisolibacter tropicus]